MLDVEDLTKNFGARTAVDRLSVRVRPGVVTGFLGPNGAGKTTTLRVAVGLVEPTSGRVLIGGRRYREIAHPLFEVGTLLDAGELDPNRSGRHHLAWIARSHRIARDRVGARLEEVGLASVADRAVRTYSLGMRQRLGIAAALLGDPGLLLLDEPVNGLDPDGVRWLREMLRQFAREGRTVLLSSHLISEIAITAERLIVIGRGRLVADTTVGELSTRFGRAVQVRSPAAAALGTALTLAGGAVRATPDPDRLEVADLDAGEVGRIAAAAGIPLVELVTRSPSLEDAYLALTATASDHAAASRGDRRA